MTKDALSDIRTAINICNDLRAFEEPMQTEVNTRVNQTRLRLLEILSQAEVKLVADSPEKK